MVSSDLDHMKYRHMETMSDFVLHDLDRTIASHRRRCGLRNNWNTIDQGCPSTTLLSPAERLAAERLAAAEWAAAATGWAVAATAKAAAEWAVAAMASVAAAMAKAAAAMAEEPRNGSSTGEPRLSRRFCHTHILTSRLFLSCSRG